jgi:CRP-like cAMP-binding protein
MKQLLEAIQLKTRIDTQLKERIEQFFQPHSIAKNELLLDIDQRTDYLYFIKKGIVHTYYFSEGKEITSWFYAENNFMTAWYSFFSRATSFEAIRALEDCELYRISYSNYYKLIEQSKQFNRFAQLMTEEIVVVTDFYSKGWMQSSAHERYTQLKEFFPIIEQRVNLGRIASFLGITQETLSRIRKKK